MIKWLIDSLMQWLNDTMIPIRNQTIKWLNDAMIQWFNDSMIQWLNDSKKSMIIRYRIHWSNTRDSLFSHNVNVVLIFWNFGITENTIILTCHFIIRLFIIIFFFQFSIKYFCFFEENDPGSLLVVQTAILEDLLARYRVSVLAS